MIACGLVLVGLSSAWTTLFPPEANWSEAQAAELAALDVQITRLYKKLTDAKLRGVEIPTEPAPLVRLLEKETEMLQEMKQALGASEQTAKKLRLAGVAVFCTGVAAFFHLRRRECGAG